MKRWILLLVVLPAWTYVAAADQRPNILWIDVEDMSPHFSCYGEKTIETQRVDQLAREGTLFTRAYVTGPVCSTSRSAMITGMFQTSIGAQHHRSGRGTEKIQLPAPIVSVPVLFQRAGYYTCNGAPKGKKGRIGKTDYNFEFPRGIYDGNDWSGRKAGQPFFAQIQLHGGKYRGDSQESYEKWAGHVREQLGSITSPEDVTLPPYYPDDPVLRRDWAAYLDTVRYTDWEVGEIVRRLKSEGIYEQTLIVFITDHGISHARGKQFCYEEGIHIPFIVRGPGIPSGKRRDDLIEHIDMAALSLAAAAIKIPDWMQARDIFAKDYQPRKFAFSARDRCDETVDRIRSVSSKRYKYIRNFYPDRPLLQPCAYKDNKAILIRLRELHAAGKLDPVQEALFAPARPMEELYDLRNDPWELHNLAASPEFTGELAAHREALEDWMKETDDQGRKPEPEAMYDSDMKVYLDAMKIRHPERVEEISKNIALMKEWDREGR